MKNTLLAILTFYQKIFSPLMHQLLGFKTACRHNPTCSVYAKEVIVRQGALKGLFLAARRVVNCQPFFSL